MGIIFIFKNFSKFINKVPRTINPTRGIRETRRSTPFFGSKTSFNDRLNDIILRAALRVQFLVADFQVIGAFLGQRFSSSKRLRIGFELKWFVNFLNHPIKIPLRCFYKLLVRLPFRRVRRCGLRYWRELPSPFSEIVEDAF